MDAQLEFFNADEKAQLSDTETLKQWPERDRAKVRDLFAALVIKHLESATKKRQECDESPAQTVVTEPQLAVLRRASPKPLPPHPTARDVMLAIARLGGYHPTNGEPGWQLLGRGYQHLLMMVAGYTLGQEK